MNILSLDLGTRTGWAMRRHGESVIESGVQVFDLRRGESPGMRYLRFRRWLDEVGCATGGLLIVYEAAHHRGGAATELLCGLTTRVQEWVAVNSWARPNGEAAINHLSVHSATLKKWTTGKGNADKQGMLRAVAERGWIAGPVRVMDDNEVDAIALLHYAMAELLPTRTP